CAKGDQRGGLHPFLSEGWHSAIRRIKGQHWIIGATFFAQDGITTFTGATGDGQKGEQGEKSHDGLVSDVVFGVLTKPMRRRETDVCQRCRNRSRSGLLVQLPLAL
ncbi:MAG: hypothetical protein ACJAUW_001960, partial [Yoonia sp.]